MMHPDRYAPGPGRRAACRGLRARWPLAALLALGLSSAVGAIMPARAASTDEPCGVHFGDTVIADGQTLDCDVVVIGGSILVEDGATVEGSVNAVPGSVRILGTVSGDVSAARDIAISGAVGGNAFAVGGDIEIEGSVGGNATAARGSITLASGARVEGQVSARGDVILADGSQVDGDVIAGGDVEADGDAAVAGRITQGHTGSGGYASIPAEQDPQTGLIQAVMAVAVIILAVLFATLTALAAPQRVATIADAAAASPMLMVLLGLIAMLATLPAFLLILPIVLAPIALALGWVGLGQAWGRRVLPNRSAAQQTAAGALLLSSAAMLAFVTMFSLPRFAVVCGVGLLLLFAFAWAYAAGIATLLGGRTFKRGAPAAAPPDVDLGRGDPPAPSVDAPASTVPTTSPPPAIGDAFGVGPADPGSSAEDLPVVDLPPAVPAAAPLPVEPLPAEPPLAAEPPVPAEPLYDEARHGPPLRQVLGLSPIYAELLRSAGVKGARDLAALSPDEAARLTAAPGVLPVSVDKAAAWIRAARALLSEAG